MGLCELDLSSLCDRPVTVCCEYGNESSVSMNSRELQM